MAEKVQPLRSPEETLAALARIRERTREEIVQRQPLDTGGTGGGDNGSMDPRVDRLETEFGNMRDRVAGMEKTLGHVEKEVTNFKWWLLGTTATVVLTVIATVIGTGVGIQQMTVSTFQAAGQQAQQQQPTTTSPPNIIINVPPTPPAAPAQPTK